MNSSDQDFIPLEIANNVKNDNENADTNYGNVHYRRKRENKASTYGLNSAANTRFLREDGGLTPWRTRSRDFLYSTNSGVIGCV